MSYRRTRAVFIKELHHIGRDPRSLGMALAVPVVMLLLFGYALSLDVDRVPTLVYDQSGTDRSRDLVRQFQGSRYFEIRGFVDSYAAIEHAIDRNQVLIGLVIPRDYSENVASGREAAVQVLLDGSDSNTAAIAKGYAESIVRTYSNRLRIEAANQRAGLPAEPAGDNRVRIWYNSSLESKNYVVPGLIAVILQIIAALLTSLTIAREREMGTLEQVASTPLRSSEIVLGKMFAYFVLGLADAAIVVLVGVLVFRVPFRGSIPMLLVSACVFLVGALFWGILVSSLARSQVEAYQLGFITSFLPAFLLSGFIYAVENMPAAIQVFTRVIPSRYFVSILKGVYLKGSGFAELWAELGLLALYAGVVFLAATRRLNRKIA